METNNWYIRGKRGCRELVKQELIKRGATIDINGFPYYDEYCVFFVVGGVIFGKSTLSTSGKYIIKNWKEVKVEEPKPKHTFKPYDKVLVCRGEGYYWFATFFSCYNPNDTEHYYRAINNGTYSHCLPYEGNEHLVGVKFKPEHIKDYDE